MAITGSLFTFAFHKNETTVFQIRPGLCARQNFDAFSQRNLPFQVSSGAVRTENLLKTELFINDASRYSYDFPNPVFVKHNFKMIAEGRVILIFSGVMWTKYPANRLPARTEKKKSSESETIGVGGYVRAHRESLYTC